MKESLQHAINNDSVFRISTLVFIKNEMGELLLLKRTKSPNKGKWSPIGGKLEIEQGESPFECAMRETEEEAGFLVKEKDMHLFSYISEKSYEGTGHWLMFLFNCKKKLISLPENGDEGKLAFFDRSKIESLQIPATDRLLIWPLYDRLAEKGFAAVRANCENKSALKIEVEEEF
jgi:8-oxo-dGTP diphosphatase